MTPKPRAPAAPQGRRIVVLCNPGSGHVRKDLERVRGLGRELGGELYREAGGATEIAQAVGELIEAEADTLCIIGGDGTVQGALTALHALRPDEPWPVVAPVPGGSTNMTIRDFGGGGALVDRLRALRTLVEGAESDPERLAAAVVRRPLLCIEHGKEPAVCGMFFGAGAVADGVRFFNQRLRSLGLGDQSFSRLSIARVLLSLALRGTRTDSVGCRVSCAVDGRETTEYQCIFCLASTLDRLVIGTRPYWGDGDGPLRFTLVEKGARAFWRSLPRIARGRRGTRLTPERGYVSHNANSVDLTFDGPFVVDGETYEARSADGPCRITMPRSVDWLIP